MRGDVAPVTAGFPVRFCLLTDGNRQYVAYYDADHQMTIASRMLDSEACSPNEESSTSDTGSQQRPRA